MLTSTSVTFSRDCTGLKSNTETNESMSCHSGAIRGQCSIKGYKRRHEGTRETYNKRKEKRTLCPLPGCGKALAIGSLQSHLRTQHGMDISSSIIAEVEVLASCLYKLSFIQQPGHSQQKIFYPAILQRHFFNCYYTYKLHIEEDNNVPSYCRACSISVLFYSL